MDTAPGAETPKAKDGTPEHVARTRSTRRSTPGGGNPKYNTS